MAMTPEGAFYPTFPDDPPFSTSGWGEVRFGDGAPDAGIGMAGDIYVDVVGGAIYFYGPTGWQAVSAGGGTGGAGMVGVVDPEGVVVADIGTVYANRVEHTLWYKETGSGTATFWQQYS